MHLSAAGHELLKKSEGFRDHTYSDVAGFRTIGYGHRLAPTESYPDGITQGQAESILNADIAIAESAVQSTRPRASNAGSVRRSGGFRL